MRLVSTDEKCPKCESALDIVLEVPYFKRIGGKKAAKKPPTVLDATGFTCGFCDTKWTLDEILFNAE